MKALLPLFHGSTARLARGSIILPGSELRGRGRTPWVYLSTSAEDALSWAAARAARDGFATANQNDPYATRTTIPLYAYRVEPRGLELAPRGFYRCRRARVLERSEPRSGGGEVARSASLGGKDPRKKRSP